TLTERWSTQRREDEAGCAIPARRPVVEVGVYEEIVAAIFQRALQGVVREDRIAVREPLLDLGLERVVAVVGAVAEVIDILRPAELVEEALALVARERPEADQSRLVDVVVRAVAGEDGRPLVADVRRLQRERVGQLVLDR